MDRHEFIDPIPEGCVRNGIQPTLVTTQDAPRDSPRRQILGNLGTLHADVKTESAAEEMDGVGVDAGPVLELPRGAQSHDGDDAVPVLGGFETLLGIVDELVLQRAATQPRVDLALEAGDEVALVAATLLQHDVARDESAFAEEFVGVDDGERCGHTLGQDDDGLFAHEVLAEPGSARVVATATVR